MTELSSSGLYIYGVVRRGAACVPLRSQGVAPAGKVEFLVEGPLAVAFGRVSLEDFSPGRVEALLKANETQWVEEKALAHAAVLQELMERGPVVPVRFGAVCRDEGRLLARVMVQEDEMLALLERLAGSAEWGVKVSCSEEAVRDALAREDPEAAGVQSRLKDMSPGTAYLQRKRLHMSLDQKARECLPLWVEQIHQALAEFCEDAVALDPPSYEPVGQGESMVCNGAYLVRQEETARFHQRMKGLGEVWSHRGLRFALSGPWPPYHFVQGRFEAESR
ncbi:MAG: GvpL/GvpF family gas vesicle protein [Chloroflexi bacterium]|nr:GvpL/GvpF family gas vesicle protein [Chloroflexota bacterium]